MAKEKQYQRAEKAMAAAVSVKTEESQESDLRPKKQSDAPKPDEPTEWQRPFEWDLMVDLANQEVFGNKEFRENQREIINATKSGKDVLALIPTGGGKSLTF